LIKPGFARAYITGEDTILDSRERKREREQIALWWSHDQKTQRPATEGCIVQPQGTRQPEKPRSRKVVAVNSSSWALEIPDWRSRAQNREIWENFFQKP
jgi:hypothetical protein